MLDYGSGNLRSIYNGFKKIGSDVSITSDKDMIRDADALILPGVGAFGAVMENLINYKDLIYDHIHDDKPLLGICLGLQMLFTGSEETPDVKGLDIFKGEAKRFKLPDEYKIPYGMESNNSKSNR